ncbi:MAG: aldose 1-epimerase [Chloroflexi bacterium]|nr:aldose 1-epimerase [Chloroflexota bacterium]
MLTTDDDGLPAGWQAERADLARLATPDGATVAWLAPAIGGNCVGFAVRQDGGWQAVLHSEGPVALRERPSRFGVPIMFPFPGHMPGARYAWRGATYALPSNVPAGDVFLHGFAHTRPWRLVAAGPDTATVELSTPADLTPAERAGFPFAVRTRLDLRVEPRALAITLTATNEGDTDAPVGLGLHPYFDPSLFGGDRTAARLTLPGRLGRTVRPLPTGPTRPVAVTVVTPPPLGTTSLVSRTDLGADAAVTLTGPTGRPRVVMHLLEGVQDLLVFAPAEHASVSVEPLSSAPSGASQPDGHPDGLVGLAPGAQRRLAVRVAFES